MKNYFVLILLIAATIDGQAQKALTRPNILWITCEDMSLHLGSYGDKQVSTPNLDRLASEGIRYTYVFSTAGVCAPSRSAIITGMYQQSIGTQHMRTFKTAGGSDKSYPPGFTSYSAMIPKTVKCFPEYLRATGYYCTNNEKQDYQFQAPPTVWDESGKKAHWRNRPDAGQPFFSVFNIITTHESQVWARASEPMLVDPQNVIVPPYYPDIPEVRMDIARHLSNVMVMDKEAGQILKQLEEDGLTDNTIVFFFSDHGDGLPFVKRELYDRGTHVPMIIRFGKKVNNLSPYAGVNLTDDQLIDFTDLAPTALSLAGIPLPAHLQGRAFLGPSKSSPRQYVFAARDRMDSEYDRVRAMRDRQFLYIRNYMPEKPFYQNISYRLQQPGMRAILKMKDEGKLNEQQALWFRPTKPVEELYDCLADPYQFNNLAADPQYEKKLVELRNIYETWKKKTGDQGEVAESEMVKNWWNGASRAPATANPEVLIKGSTVTVSDQTEGASIGYKFRKAAAWKVYTSPVNVKANDSLYVVAHRIGYDVSEIVSQKIK